MKAWSCSLLLVLAAGCVSAPSTRWLREDVHPVAVKGDRRLDHAKIWSRDSVMEWRDVLVTRDSISGIPFTSSKPCEACRRSLPDFAVDSLIVGYDTKAGDSSSEEKGTPVWAPLFILLLLVP